VSIEAPAEHEQTARRPSQAKGRLRRNAIPLALVLAVLAELAFRAAAPSLRTPLLWPDWETQNKVAAIDRLAGRGGASIVFVGSSVVNAGFDPRVVTTSLRLERPAFNAALNGSDLRTTDFWTRNVVVPRLHPDVVVIGFNSPEANDGWNAPNSIHDKFFHTPLGGEATGAGGVFGAIERWLIRRSTFVRYRSLFSHPVDAFSGNDKAQKAQGVDGLGRLDALGSFLQRPYSPRPDRALAAWQLVFRNYHVGGPQFGALGRLVNTLTEKGIRVVIVRMPVSPDIQGLHPHGAADRDAFSRTLDDFVASHAVTLVDAETEIGSSPALFVDPLHLNGNGRRSMTALIVARLRALI